jgi:DNA polymerase-3 subunit alpha
MFIHLHTHSDNSILNGVMKVDKMVKKAKEYEMPAVALTDIGSMYPAVTFHQKAQGEGIKPIFGVHANLAPRTRFDKEARTDEKTSTLVLLAKNLEGYHNLIRIISQGHLDGFYYRARIDKELLEKYHDGLILLSGGAGGEIGKNINLGNYDAAKEIAQYYKKLFGDDFYMEITRLGTHVEGVIEEKMVEIARELDIPLVATNDVYYEKQEDSEVREVLWCIDGGRQMSDPSRRRPESDQQYFKSPAEMEELFKDLPEAIENTVKVAEKVEEYSISFGKVQPKFAFLPEGETEDTYLRKLVFDNAEKKFGYFHKELEDRLNYELGVIHDKGYDGYFLVVWSIVNWARENDILVSTRGSAAGCAVSYSIGITTVDPLRWGLVFERFLNPERKSLPDIDLDISDHGRDRLIEWVKESYGKENFCNVGALGKLTTKAAIRDVGRVLGIELGIIDKLSKLIPVKFGRVLSISACIADEAAGKELKVIKENQDKINEFRTILKEDGDDLQGIYFDEESFKIYFEDHPEKNLKKVAEVSSRFHRLLRYVIKIEGCVRNISTHACGHLITSPSPISDFCPVQKESGSRERIITQFEGKYLEDLGLMKFDFLGLANLSIIDFTVKFVRERHIKDFDIYEVPLDDPKAYSLLQNADTTAVFQLESGGMKKYLKDLHPDNFEEINAMVAMYRPGPMDQIPLFIERKFGRAETTYLVPELEPILKTTYGIAIYQEQILKIASTLCGYTLGAADNIRKAVGKKIVELMASEEKKFKEGFLENYPHYGEEKANKLWEYVLPFADYGFNKAHSAAYALVAYHSAYLKANYPTEFYAALMLSDIDTQDKLVRDILEAEAHSIKLLTPSINKSDAYFTIEEEGVIRFGIGGMKGVGLKAIKSIVEERNINGEFKSLDDFCSRIDHKMVTKGAIEALIKIGAMEDFGTRSGLLQVFEAVYVQCQKMKASEASGFVDMFSAGDTKSEGHQKTKIPTTAEVDDLKKIEWEKQYLGVAITPSLVMKITPYLQSKGYKMLHEVQDEKEKSAIKVFGQITRKNEITTKNGDQMCFMQIADASGPLSITIFPRTYEKCSDLVEGDYVSIKGKTQKRNDEMQLLVDEIKVVKDYELKTAWDKWEGKVKSEKLKVKKGEKFESNKAVVKESPESTVIPAKAGIHPSEPISTNQDEVKEPFKAYSSDQSSNPTALQPSNFSTSNQPSTSTPSTSVEIFVKKDTPIDELKKLSEFIEGQRSEAGIEVYIHLPNHVVVRKIKLEGHYLPVISSLSNDFIEKIDIF